MQIKCDKITYKSSLGIFSGISKDSICPAFEIVEVLKTGLPRAGDSKRLYNGMEAKLMEAFKKSIAELENEILEINKELEHAPKGRLVKKGATYYQVIQAKEKGITKNTQLVKALCRKKYLRIRKKKLEQNLLVSGHNKKFVDVTPQSMIKKFPKTYQNLPSNYFYHPSVETFLTTPYQPNTYKLENKSYHSSNGISLRSKSELMIANELEAYDIPYCYEKPLNLKGQIKYPDFTILNPYNGKLIIWEHFGAFHKDGYEANMTSKMKDYLLQGFEPFENIIYTFEFDTQTPGRLKNLIETIIL